jgi:heme A synthase
MSTKEWEAEFSRYKTFPEWQQRQSMTLDEFKFIYFWEWGHRMLGRSLGLLFIGEYLNCVVKWPHNVNPLQAPSLTSQQEA